MRKGLTDHIESFISISSLGQSKNTYISRVYVFMHDSMTIQRNKTKAENQLLKFLCNFGSGIQDRDGECLGHES